MVCAWRESMCSRCGACMAECGEVDVWGAEKGFVAACGSAGDAWQIVRKMFDNWELRGSQVSRDMNTEGYAMWRVYRAAVCCVYEGCGGARVLYLRQVCVLGVVWKAVITGGNAPRREGTSRHERNVEVGQVQGRHGLVKDPRGTSARRHSGGHGTSLWEKYVKYWWPPGQQVRRGSCLRVLWHMGRLFAAPIAAISCELR